MDFRPDLLPTIRHLEVHAKRNALSRTLSGNWLSRIKGRGIEFFGYRQYVSGDDAGMIDWKASLRSRRLLVKELNEEKSLNIYVLLDVSDTMLFGTTDKLKAEYAAELVSSLSFAMLRAGENVALALFAERIKRFVPLSQGLAHHPALLKAIGDITMYGGSKNFGKVAPQLLSIMESGLVILISDFLQFDEEWERYFKIISKKYDLICIGVRDPRDRALPDTGEYVLSDPTTGQRLVIDASDYAKPYKDFVLQEEKHLRELMLHAHGDFLMLETTENYSRAIVQFMLLHSKRSAE
jgi:uncharacterized protein (DUF58 family)